MNIIPEPSKLYQDENEYIETKNHVKTKLKGFEKYVFNRKVDLKVGKQIDKLYKPSNQNTDLSSIAKNEQTEDNIDYL